MPKILKTSIFSQNWSKKMKNPNFAIAIVIQFTNTHMLTKNYVQNSVIRDFNAFLALLRASNHGIRPGLATNSNSRKDNNVMQSCWSVDSNIIRNFDVAKANDHMSYTAAHAD